MISSVLKNTREFSPRVSLKFEPQGFVALAAAGLTDGAAAGFLVEAVARPGLFSVSIISLVKSTFSGAYSTTGTPLMLTPDLSSTKSRLLLFTSASLVLL